VDRPPTKPFASVGIVEVQGPVTKPPETLLKVAVAEGTKVGCDVLAHQAFYEQRRGTTMRNYANGVASWLFSCGVFDATRQAEETAKWADAVAEKIVRNAFGEIVCPTEQQTGSHMPRRICRPPGSTWPYLATRVYVP